MLYIVSTSLAFLLALILFTKIGKTRADLILGCWLVIIGVHLALYYLVQVTDRYYHPYLLVSLPFPLFHGPFLYFYTASLTNQHAYLKKNYVWHLVPIVFLYSTLIPFYLRPHAEQLAVLAREGAGYKWVFLTQRVLVWTSGVAYVALSLWLLRAHVRNVQHRFSHTEKINLVWLRYLIYGAGVVWLTLFTRNDFIIFSLIAILVLVLGYFGIKQVGIFTQTSASVAATVPDAMVPAPATDHSLAAEPTKGRYLKSTLSSARQAEIHQKLIRAMNEQKLFLNPELTLTQLAEALAVHPHHLSQVINSQEAKTFYDFINTWRVNQFKKIAAEPANQKYTLLALAFECGFNSKTAFYRNFKNLTGQSPTQYLKEQHIAIAVD